MRTTPTAYRSWAGSGSAPYLAPGDTWSGVPITWVTRVSRGSAMGAAVPKSERTMSGAQPGRSRMLAGFTSRWTSPAEWMTWRASSSWPMAGSTQACDNEP